MLGIGKQKPGFQVAVHGKHPGFDDYFTLNMDSPLACALVNWVEKGTELKKNHDNTRIHAFRFWIRGVNRGELVFGIIKDSSDSLGRAYPLVIMVTGFVKDWEKRWHYIFSTFDTVFRMFEDISASHYENFKEFEKRLEKVISLGLAKVKDLEMKQQHKDRAFHAPPLLPEIMLAWFNKNMKKGAMTLSVATLSDKFASYTPVRRNQGVFKNKANVPGAVFLGGLPDNPVLAMFSRPLKAGDFLNLF